MHHMSHLEKRVLVFPSFSFGKCIEKYLLNCEDLWYE